MNPDPTAAPRSTRFQSLSAALHQAVRHASDALAKWLERPASISIDTVDLVPLQDAAQLLGSDEKVVCCCATNMAGRLSGELILVFDDASGLALADLLLNQTVGTATTWNEMEQSAALETANIVGCAYLNELAHLLPEISDRSRELLPSPPTFRRDFAGSILESALIDQATTSDQVFVARATFHIDESTVDWHFFFVPDAKSVTDLATLPTKPQ